MWIHVYVYIRTHAHFSLFSLPVAINREPWRLWWWTTPNWHCQWQANQLSKKSNSPTVTENRRTKPCPQLITYVAWVRSSLAAKPWRLEHYTKAVWDTASQEALQRFHVCAPTPGRGSECVWVLWPPSGYLRTQKSLPCRWPRCDNGHHVAGTVKRKLQWRFEKTRRSATIRTRLQTPPESLKKKFPSDVHIQQLQDT